MSNLAYSRWYRAITIETGGCTSCKVNQAKPDRRTCQPCIDYRRRRYHRRIELGMPGRGGK